MPGRARGFKPSKQPSGVGPPWTVGAFAEGSSFLWLPEPSMGRVGLRSVEASSSGRKGPRGAQEVHPFMQEAFTKHLSCTKLALGVSRGYAPCHPARDGVQAESAS